MLSRSTSTRHGHHHHNNNNSPPRDYTDLSKTDISLLAPIFAPLPTPETSAAATYRLKTKQLISELPSHLQAKIPKLSTFCSMHHHLNPMPIIDLLKVMQNEVSPAGLHTWRDTQDLPLMLLRDINAVWTKATSTSSSTGTWSYNPNKCAACHLATLARSTDALIALGAITIARLNPKNWKKSKRIFWFEEWLKGAVPWRQEGKAALDVMWKMGVRLSQGMSTKGERPWVDGYVKMATAPPSPTSTQFGGKGEGEGEGHVVRRPPRSPSQTDHVAFVTEALQEQDPFDDPPAPRSPTTTIHNPFEEPDNEAVMDELFPSSLQHSYEHGSAIPGPLRPTPRPSASSIYSTDRLIRTPATTNTDNRVASSVYSQRADEGDDDEAFWRAARSSETSENEVIEAYRGSRRRGQGGFL